MRTHFQIYIFTVQVLNNSLLCMFKSIKITIIVKSYFFPILN